jgi:branched-chain amino acid transport system ATP-binding protein
MVTEKQGVGMNGQVCLQASGIGKRYGGLDALADISMDVPHGIRHVILGPNGAGKTTFFKILSGEIAPTSGTVSFCGQDITSYPPHRRTGMGIGRTFQVTTLFRKLTTLENVILAVQGVRRSKFIPYQPVSQMGSVVEEAYHVLDQVGLKGREPVEVDSLAYGEQRLLEIGLAVASHPTLLLLDEPTSGLARSEVPKVVALLRSLPREMTIVFIEHDMDVAFSLAETVTVLSLGRKVAEGPLEEVRKSKLVQEIYLGEG